MIKSIEKFGKLVLNFLLVATAFIYLVKDVQPKLHYQVQQPAFLSGNDFFSQHIIFPGGIAEYISEFIMQFFMGNWQGAFALVLLALILSFSVIAIVKNLFGKSNFDYFIIGFSLIIVVALASNYLFPLSILVKIVLSSLFVFALTLFNFKLVYKVVACIVFSIFVYWISGGIALYYFALFVAFIHLNKPNKTEKYVISLLAIFIAAIIPIISFHTVFNIGSEQAFFGLVPNNPSMLKYRLDKYFYILLGFPVLILMLEKTVKFVQSILQGKNSALPAFKYWHIILLTFQIFVLLVSGYYILKNATDHRTKNELLVNYYAENQEWQKVLEIANNFKEYNFKINFEYNRALFHLGRFSEDMFSYPQLLGNETLFIDKNVAGTIAQMSSDLYFDLGHITESLRWAYETQTLLPNSPRVLKRIVVGNIILGNYEAADVYLNLLTKNFMYKSWTEKYRNYIENPGLTNSDNFIAEKRRQLPKNCITPTKPVNVLNDLLKSDPKNTMAFEYLQAYYLFNHQLEDFVNNLKMMDELNYSKMPKAYEEAIILFKTQHPEHPLATAKISEYTFNDFKQFSTILASAKGKKDRVRPTLYKYSDTYWYYVIYLSPVVTKNQLKTREAQ